MSSRLTADQWPVYSVTATYWVRESGWGNWNHKEHQETKTFSDLKPDRYVCQTAFSLNGDSPYTSLREGFLWETSGVFFLQNNRGETGWIRPVQDVQ
jgi:hypothetical protein